MCVKTFFGPTHKRAAKKMHASDDAARGVVKVLPTPFYPAKLVAGWRVRLPSNCRCWVKIDRHLFAVS